MKKPKSKTVTVRRRASYFVVTWRHKGIAQRAIVHTRSQAAAIREAVTHGRDGWTALYYHVAHFTRDHGLCQSEGPRGETICVMPLGHEGPCGWEKSQFNIESTKFVEVPATPTVIDLAREIAKPSPIRTPPLRDPNAPIVARGSVVGRSADPEFRRERGRKAIEARWGRMTPEERSNAAKARAAVMTARKEAVKAAVRALDNTNPTQPDGRELLSARVGAWSKAENPWVHPDGSIEIAGRYLNGEQVDEFLAWHAATVTIHSTYALTLEEGAEKQLGVVTGIEGQSEP